MVLQGIALHCKINILRYCIVLYAISWYCMIGIALLALEQDTYLLSRPSLRQDVEAEEGWPGTNAD